MTMAVQRRLAMTCLAVLLTAGTALAEDPAVERIMRELRALGYTRVSIERTLLGRSRILADSADASREVIVNPVTGEILRDLWIPHSGRDGRSDGLLRSASGDGGRDGGDDDNDDGDEGNDDNSGSGGDDGGDGGKGRGRGRGGDDD